jgi:Cu-processing system permease protein
MSTTLRIARYGMRDLARSRWLLAYTLFFFGSTAALVRFADTPEKAMLSLSNVALLLVPLVNVVFGSMYLYGAREFVELLLAQPVRRRQLYAGLYLGLTVPVALASALGIAAPLLLEGAPAGTLKVGATIALISALLSAVFAGIAAVIAYAIEDRVRGLVMAIGVWLALAVLYDAAVLIAVVQFADYPLERPMLLAMLANPIDLARVLMLEQFDVAALLGYTGAVFQRFLGGAGSLVAASAILLWIALPAVAGARLFHRKDF